ncbi:MAG TPA: GRAS family protein [Longimicrobiaceae bacterium]|nr:GRAS family protein [Longimicrobiaceae bacterium]
MNVSKENALRAVLRAALEGREDDARILLNSVVEDRPDPGTDPEGLQDYIFASALSRRLDPECSAEINLYLRQFELSQISLFNLLAQHLPTVSLSVAVSNQLLGSFLEGWEEVTLFDVGIGTARQEAAVLREMAARDALPRRLTVIALEPDAASLCEAEAVLSQTAHEIGLDLDFRPMNMLVEELEDRHWGLIGSAPGPLVVHSAFALHHIRNRHNGFCSRAEFFRKLRLLSPLAVVLCEPSSDHHTGLLGERFENCWRHFGLTFDLIDRGDLPAREAAAIKMFFAREIQDILGNTDDSRCERHESVVSWVERLRRAGFTPYDDFALPDGIRHEVVSIRPREGYVGLDYAGETLVAVICATSGDPAAAARAPAPAPLILQVA